MMKRIHRAVSGVARTPVLPARLRSGYALVMKRLWRFLPAPLEAEVARVGRMWVNPSDFIDARLFFYRTWEPVMSAFIADRLKPGDVLIDIGANIGYYSLLAGHAVGPAGKVYAIEPSPDIRAKLDRNIALNGLGNVDVVPYGISDKAERRSFALATANLGASRFGEPVQEGGLELRRLADVIDPADLSRVALIKVDVEGMEAAVLTDIAYLLPRLSPDVVIATELRASADIDAVLATFRAAGFSMVLLENSYSMHSYAKGREPAPQPIDTLPAGQHDIALVPARTAALAAH